MFFVMEIWRIDKVSWFPYLSFFKIMIIKKTVFLYEKPIEVIVNLLENKNRKVYFNSVARELSIEYAYAKIIIDKFISIELVERKKEGRMVYLSLTKKGISIAKNFQNLLYLLNGGKPVIKDKEHFQESSEILEYSEKLPVQ